MFNEKDLTDSPLSLQELQHIEATNLPNLERHHLRLLAHCLACFKLMSNGLNTGSLPSEDSRLQWCLDQPSLANESAFVSVLLEQFSVAGQQLEYLADISGKSPLELTLEDLIQARIHSQAVLREPDS